METNKLELELEKSGSAAPLGGIMQIILPIYSQQTVFWENV